MPNDGSLHTHLGVDGHVHIAIPGDANYLCGQANTGRRINTSDAAHHPRCPTCHRTVD